MNYAGKPDNIEITEDDYGHGYTKKNREAMYAFFQKHLQLPGSPAEEEVEFLTAQELQKTTSGQLSTSLGGETVFSLNRKETEELINNLQASRGDLTNHLSGGTYFSQETFRLSGSRQSLMNLCSQDAFNGKVM